MGKQTPQDTKKTEHKPQGGPPAHQSAPSQPKGGAGQKVGCHALGCKDKDVRFNFCDEHFRQYKFGLVNKAGEKVLDYEKKFEHYQRWLRAQKVA